MTRQEAIEWFKLMKEKFENTKYAEALNMAIEALEQEETLQNLTEPNKSDLISRQEACKIIERHIRMPWDQYGKGWNDAIDAVIDHYLLDVPSAEPKDKITCKDCVHFMIKGDIVKYGYCDMWNYPIDDDGYCYLGRKE